MTRFDDKVVIVTGAGSGIGRATAKRFAACGATVIVSDIDKDRALATVHEIETRGGRSFAYAVDVSNERAMGEFAAAVRDSHGVPHVVVNNAGYTTVGPFLEHSVADWERLMGVNLWGQVYGSRLFGQQMVDSGRGGRIINVSSVAAAALIPASTAYCTVKAASHMFTECLRMDLAGTGVGVTALAPAFTNTNFFNAAENAGSGAGHITDDHRAIASFAAGIAAHSPDNYAKTIVRVAAGNPAVSTPIESRMLWFLTRLSPAGARLAARLLTVDTLEAILDVPGVESLLRRVTPYVQGWV